ncbi:MAG: glucose-6-phosphate isomerase [Halieaceae bacterium]
MGDSSASGTQSNTAAFPYPDSALALNALAAEHRDLRIESLLESVAARVEQFSCTAAGWHLDYSRQLLSGAAREALLALARESGLESAREGLFDGRPLNHTEGRAVLHTLLRATSADPALQDEIAAVGECRQRMADWVERIHSGTHRGYTNQPISDVVNLGIGGSDLGPRMVVEALRPYHHDAVRVHFCANVDPDDLSATLQGLNPATTLFIICSKTLKTEETLHNAKSARNWLLAAGAGEDAIAQHFLAVSTNLDVAREFGIPEQNILPMWDWVGGRYSLWSAVGWSIAFALGTGQFEELLAGAEKMDEHFRSAPLEQNLPVCLSLLEIWYVNFFSAQCHAVIPYHQDLARLPSFLQQLSMESNGKRVNHQGQTLSYATAPVLWGDAGSNGQHSFHQLFHQGSVLCPIDFILVSGDQSRTDTEGKQRLLANGLSQARALLTGRDLEASRQSLLQRGLDKDRAAALAPHLVIPGNRPSSSLSCEQLTPETLGALLALYEHKTFCSGHIWQINSFDQWGVELGKALGAEIYAAMLGEAEGNFDASTAAILEKIHHG